MILKDLTGFFTLTPHYNKIYLNDEEASINLKVGGTFFYSEPPQHIDEVEAVVIESESFRVAMRPDTEIISVDGNSFLTKGVYLTMPVKVELVKVVEEKVDVL